MRRRIRRLLDRLRDRWEGEPGRHAYAYREIEATTQPMPIIGLRLREPQRRAIAERQAPAWAIEARGEPDPAYLAEAEEQLAEALLRAMYPRLYWPAEDYWRECWRDFCIKGAQQTARVNEARRRWRAECGLPPIDERRERLPLPAVA